MKDRMMRVRANGRDKLWARIGDSETEGRIDSESEMESEGVSERESKRSFSGILCFLWV